MAGNKWQREARRPHGSGAVEPPRRRCNLHDRLVSLLSRRDAPPRYPDVLEPSP